MKFIEYNYLLGVLNHEILEFQQEIQIYQKILCIKLENFQLTKEIQGIINFRLGNIYSAQSKENEAIQYFKKTIEIYPRFDPAYYNCGISYKVLNQIEEAIDMCQKSLEIKPYDHHTLFLYGNCLKQQKKYNEACEIYQTVENLIKAKDIENQFHYLYHNWGRCLINIENYEQAVITFEIYLEKNPDSDITYFYIGVCYGKLQLIDDAIQAFKKALEINPQDSNSQFNLAVYQDEIGQNQEAQKSYLKCIELDPQEYLAFIYLGYLEYSKFSNKMKGIEYFTKAMLIDETKTYQELQKMSVKDCVKKCTKIIKSQQKTPIRLKLEIKKFLSTKIKKSLFRKEICKEIMMFNMYKSD